MKQDYKTREYWLANPADTNIDEATLTTYLGEYSVQAITLIDTDNARRTTKLNHSDTTAKEKLTLLNTGVWYPQGYLSWISALAVQSKSALQRLQWLQKKNAFQSGHMNPKHWRKPKDNSADGVTSFQFVWKDQTQSPAEEIVNILLGDSFCILECGITINVAHYAAVLKVWGKERFDKVFTASNTDYTAPCKISFYHVQNPMYCLITGQADIKREQIQLGDRVGFNNHPAYTGKHPLGAAKAWNTFCSVTSSTDVSQIRYSAFGFDGKQLSEQEVYQLFCNEYNAPTQTADAFAQGQNQQELSAWFDKKIHEFERSKAPQQIDCRFFNKGQFNGFYDKVVRLKTSSVKEVLVMKPGAASLQSLFLNLPTTEMRKKAIDQVTLQIWAQLATQSERQTLGM